MLQKLKKFAHMGKKQNEYYKTCKPCCITINGKIYAFKSRLEAVFALYFEDMVRMGKLYKWEYETDVFRFNCEKTASVKQYNPDFKIWHDNKHFEFIECKGKMLQTDIRKKRLMSEQFRSIKITFAVSGDEFCEYLRHHYYDQLIMNICNTSQANIGLITDIKTVWKSQYIQPNHKPKPIKRKYDKF